MGDAAATVGFKKNVRPAANWVKLKRFHIQCNLSEMPEMPVESMSRMSFGVKMSLK
jgi:hypothetical protein